MTKKSSHISTLPFFQGLLFSFITLAFALSLISYHPNNSAASNFLGLFGHYVSLILYFLFGFCAYLIPLASLWTTIQLFQGNLKFWAKSKIICFFFFLSSLCLFATIFAEYFPIKHPGGTPLHFIYNTLPMLNLKMLFGQTGTFFLGLATFCFSSFFLLDGDLNFLKILFLKIKETFLLKKKVAKSQRFEERPALLKTTAPVASLPATKETLARIHPLQGSKIQLPPKEKETPPPPPPAPIKHAQFPNFTFPSSDLLTSVKKIDNATLKNDLQRQAAILEETLLSFGIEAKVGDIHSGPTITSFEVHPAVGVKVQKIKAVENDIALNMQAKSIRIIAPIPGKAAVGIELPNITSQEVNFREIYENYQNNPKKARIPLLLGKAVNGEDIFADLVKTPHMLIAGATGSGKSVCINTIVMSIVMNTHPDEVKFIMVDPKKVELSAYTPLPHMLTPVITEADEARSALLYLVKEMEKRYELFRTLGHRNIESFNQRKPNIELESTFEEEVPKYLPYIVLIIDEFADLMMIADGDIETPIARIAQMARAVGIHMILATQRPSREVITGLIKANFPSRIAFKVSSRINSQIILDDCGAESLLGNGDMLFMPPGTSYLSRAQGAFIRDEDIHRVIDFLKKQSPVQYLISSFKDFKPVIDANDDQGGSSSKDVLYDEAKKLVWETGNASTTFLQRKLKIGYARAASLMDELEKHGIIGPQDGAKPRKIYYPNTDSED